MEIWLDQVREEPFAWEETLDVPAASLERTELLALGPVHWWGRVAYVPPAFILKARLRYEQTLLCFRCLQPVVEPVEGDIQFLVYLGNPPGGGPELALQEADLGVLYVEGEILETQPILLEQLHLNVPMKPLCRPDCAGLCPRCGENRNFGACACPEAEGDPRWAALAALRPRLTKNRKND